MAEIKQNKGLPQAMREKVEWVSEAPRLHNSTGLGIREPYVLSLYFDKKGVKH